MRRGGWDALQRRATEVRRARRMAADTAAHLSPPHPSAYGAHGRNTWVAPPARVSLPECIFLGDDVIIGEYSWLSVVRAVDGFEPRLSIGAGCRLGRMIDIACVGDIEIGPNVLTAERVFIADTHHRYEDASRPVVDQPMAEPRKVVIGEGAFLGIGCAVLRGVTVGEGAYIGAGAVVTRDVAPHTLVVGNPARPVRQFDAARGWIDL